MKNVYDTFYNDSTEKEENPLRPPINKTRYNLMLFYEWNMENSYVRKIKLIFT